MRSTRTQRFWSSETTPSPGGRVAAELCGDGHFIVEGVPENASSTIGNIRLDALVLVGSLDLRQYELILAVYRSQMRVGFEMEILSDDDGDLVHFCDANN
jgi:hypothetical protein